MQTVLIVPLWNWNASVPNGSWSAADGINCTVVELKLAYCDSVHHVVYCINCTVVELKLLLIVFHYWTQFVLIVPLWNWNLGGYGAPVLDTFVLIVPLWNWNTVGCVSTTADSSVLIVPLWNWNWFLANC